MKLYTSRLAPNPRRVAWFLAEKGVTDLDIEDIDLLTGAHKSAEFTARAGLANVPALTLDDGETITESIAICRYLESIYPEPNLFGVGPRETAVIEMWTRRVELLAASPMMMAVRHGHPALAALETQIPAVKDNNFAAAQRALPFLDHRLATSEWIGADRVTLADGVLFAGLEFARMVRFKIPDDLVHLTRWQTAMRARPSASAGA